MSNEQLNLRIPGDLTRQVRMRAAELGIKPRDVVVEALEALFSTGPAPTAAAPIPGQTTIPVPEISGEISGETQGRGCPECGGDLAKQPTGVLVCDDCDYAVSP